MKLILSILFFLNPFVTFLAQNNTQAGKEVEIYMLTQDFDLDHLGIFYKIKSVQDFVLENDVDRYIFNFTNDPKYINSTLPLGAPGLNNEKLITGNSTFPNSKTWPGFDFVAGTEEGSEGDPSDQPDFAYGLYELTPYGVLLDGSIIQLKGKFYLDYRDSYYP